MRCGRVWVLGHERFDSVVGRFAIEKHREKVEGGR